MSDRQLTSNTPMQKVSNSQPLVVISGTSTCASLYIHNYIHILIPILIPLPSEFLTSLLSDGPLHPHIYDTSILILKLQFLTMNKRFLFANHGIATRDNIMVISTVVESVYLMYH